MPTPPTAACPGCRSAWVRRSWWVWPPVPPSSRGAAAPEVLLDRQAQRASDEHALHLAGALADLEDLGVPVEPRHGVLLHEAVAAEHLRRDARRRDGRLGGGELGDWRRLLERRPRDAGVLHGGRTVREHPRGVGHDLEVGDLERDALLAPDRTTEGLPLAGVLDAQLEAGLDEAECEGRDRDPAVVEDREELRVAPATLAEQVVGGHPDSRERQRMGVADVPAEL